MFTMTDFQMQVNRDRNKSVTRTNQICSAGWIAGIVSKQKFQLLGKTREPLAQHSVCSFVGSCDSQPGRIPNTSSYQLPVFSYQFPIPPRNSQNRMRSGAHMSRELRYGWQIVTSRANCAAAVAVACHQLLCPVSLTSAAEIMPNSLLPERRRRERRSGNLVLRYGFRFGFGCCCIGRYFVSQTLPALLTVNNFAF